jgi:hypothetical protein
MHPRNFSNALLVLVYLGAAALGATLVGSRLFLSPPNSAHAQPADNPLGASAHPVGQVGGVTRVIVPDGHRLWIGIGPRVAAVDVANATRPRVIGRSGWLDGVVYDLAVESGIGVASTEGPLLHTLDLRDPLAPTVVGRVAIGNTVRQVALAHGFAYAIHQVVTRDSFGRRHFTRSNVAVIDNRNWLAPVVVNPELLPADVFATDLVVAGGVLAIAVTREPDADANKPQNELRIFALDDPAAPRWAASHSDSAWSKLARSQAPEWAHVVYGYWADGDLAALDVGDPARPVLLARYGANLAISRTWFDHFNLAVRDDGRPLVVQSDGFGGSVILAPGPAREPDGDRFRYQVDSIYGSPAGGFAASGQFLFVANESGRLEVLDMLDLELSPDTERTVGHLDTYGVAEDVAVGRGPDAGKLFSTSYQGGLGIFNITHPTDPRPLSLAFDGSYHAGLSVEDGIAVAAVTGSGDTGSPAYEVYDVRDPGRQVRFACLNGELSELAMARSGRFLYAHFLDQDGSRQRIDTFDFSQPTASALRGSELLTGKLGDIDADGDRLAIVRHDTDDSSDMPAEAPLRLDVYSLRDPAAPVRLASQEIGAAGRHEDGLPQLDLDGDHAFIAAPEIHIVNMADPTHLQLVASLPLPGKPISLLAQDGHAFVNIKCSGPDEPCGVVVIDARTPSAPQIIGWLPATRTSRSPERQSRHDSVAVERGLVYVASGTAGIYVYRPRLGWPPEAGVPAWPAIFMPYGAK